VEDAQRLPALQVGHPRNDGKAFSGVDRPQGVEGSGMAGLATTLRSPWPPLAMRPFPKVSGVWGGQWVQSEALLKQKRKMSLNPLAFDADALIANDTVISSLSTIHIPFYYKCKTPLPPGLYLGFLQLQCSLHKMEIFVSKSHPSSLPFVKIR
jgi:hypothetical protein